MEALSLSNRKTWTPAGPVTQSPFERLIATHRRGTLTTPEGGTVGLKNTIGPATPAEIAESILEYQPDTPEGNAGAVGGRVRVISVCEGGMSPWLQVGDASMNPI
jgi:hypothetical protein